MKILVACEESQAVAKEFRFKGHEAFSCDILRIKLTTYYDAPVNRHVMNDGSGDFFGCICK